VKKELKRFQFFPLLLFSPLSFHFPSNDRGADARSDFHNDPGEHTRIDNGARCHAGEKHPRYIFSGGEIAKKKKIQVV